MADKLTAEQVVLRMKQKRPMYDYSEVEYVDMRTPVRIRCREHGWFEKSPLMFFKGKWGCGKCGKKGKGTVAKPPEFWYQILGGMDCQVDLSTYGTMNSEVRIRCSVHGWWVSTMSRYLKGDACPSCRSTW